MASGKRERNTLVTYPCVANNSAKAELIHDMVPTVSVGMKDLSRKERPMFDQLVGRVTAYQGYDRYRV